jgi:hypothetical protein
VSDLQIRQYEPEDADTVWDLHERALGDGGVFDPAYAHLDADLREGAGRVPQPGRRVRGRRGRQ